VSVELFVLLPVLLGVLLAGIELSLLVSVRQQLAAASAQGARVAAQGGDLADVEQAVFKVLGDGALADSTVTTNLDEKLVSGQNVIVVVEIEADMAVPDLFAFVGFSIKGETLAARTVLRKE
jgi:Flp pilus assembly protein TadG